MHGLYGLLSGELGLLALCCTRLAGLVISAPLGWEMFPLRARAALVLCMALVVHGLHPRTLDTLSLSVLDWMLLVISELLLGVAMGFVVRLAVAVAEMAAEAIAMSLGLSAAQVFDPKFGTPGTALTQFFRYLALLLLLLVGVHRIVLGGVLASFRIAPIGRFHAVGNVGPDLLQFVAGAIAAGIRIAIPVIALLFMAQVALAFISRAAPAMQIFSVGFAVTLVVGTAVLLLTLPDMASQIVVYSSHLGSQIEAVLGATLQEMP